jgi:hypothetical protein
MSWIQLMQTIKSTLVNTPKTVAWLRSSTGFWTGNTYFDTQTGQLELNVSFLSKGKQLEDILGVPEPALWTWWAEQAPSCRFARGALSTQKRTQYQQLKRCGVRWNIVLILSAPSKYVGHCEWLRRVDGDIGCVDVELFFARQQTWETTTWMRHKRTRPKTGKCDIGSIKGVWVMIELLQWCVNCKKCKGPDTLWPTLEIVLNCIKKTTLGN